MNFRSFMFAGVGAALGLGSFVSAQPFSVDAARQLGLSGDRSSLIHALNPAVRSTAQVSGGSAYRDIAMSAPLTAASALSSFRIGYLNGNHAQRDIAVLRKNEGTAWVFLADGRSGDDPLNASATWWTVPGATGGEVSGNFTTNNEIAFTLPHGPAWHYLVLGGFQIFATNSVNNFDTGELNVSRLSVSTQPAVSEPRVQTPPRISVNFATHRPGTPINVKVQYAWVPYNYLQKMGSSEYYVNVGSASNRSVPVPGAGPFGGGVLGSPGATERALANIRGQRPANDRTLLTRFDFQFTNEPRPLLSLGVHLMGDTSPGGPTTEAMSWQDDNRDDPVEWSVSYVTLK